MSDRKYPETVAALWKTRGGKQFRSMAIDERTFDQLQKLLANVELGGRLVFKEVPQERRKNEKSPEAYIEYMSKELVEEEKAFIASQKDGI